MARHRYYLDTRVLTAFFFAAMPFVAFGSFIVVNMAKNQLRESVGEGLEQRAVQTKLALERHIGEQLVDLRLLAMDPIVQQALRDVPRAVPDEQRAKLEAAWAGGTDSRLGASILETPLAARLRDVADLRPGTRALQVVDANGRTIAASTRGGPLFNDQSQWWKALVEQEGEAQAFVGDVQRNQGSTYAFVDLAFPVRAPDGTLHGALRRVHDAADLYGPLAPVRVGRTGHATLVRATDGTILASDEAERILNDRFTGFESLAGALEGFPLAASGEALFGKSRARRGYWTVQAVRGEKDGRPVVLQPARVVGYSPVDQVPGVEWLVIVEQNLDEAIAPITSVTRYLWIHFIGVFVTVILLALYFSFKLERPVMDDDLHLHEEHIPASLQARAAADTEG